MNIKVDWLNTLVVFLLLTASAMKVQAAPAPAVTLVDEFDFNGSLNDALGHGTMTANSGGVGAGFLNFDLQYGPTLAINSSLAGSYSIGMVFSLSDPAGTGYNGWVSLVNFSNLNSDTNNQYLFQSQPNFYPITGNGPDTVQPNATVQLVITRNGFTGVYNCYLNGILENTFTDSGNGAVAIVQGGNAIFQLFQDDHVLPGFEASAGTLYMVKVWNGELTPAQIPFAFTNNLSTNADLQVTKTVDNSNVNPGQQVVFGVTVRNGGPGNVTNPVVVTDCLPSGFQYVTDSTYGNSTNGTYSPGTCQWTLPSGLVSGASMTLTITATAMSSGVFTNTATVAIPAGVNDSYPSNNTASAEVTVSAPQTTADLQVTKYGPFDPVTVGQNISYTIYVYNYGPSTSTNVVVRDAIPTGTAYVSSIPSGTFYPNFQRVDIPIGDLPAFASTNVTVTVQVTNMQQIVNFANAYGDTPDPDTSNNASGVTNNAVSPQADLQATKYGPFNPVTVGQNISYTIYVYNNGPSASTNVIVRDAIPTGTAYVSSIPSGTYYPNFQRVDISIGNLPAFTSTNVTVTVQVTNAQQIVNFANAYGDTPDPDTSNNASGVTNNAVNPQADLQVTKYGPSDPLTVGQSVNYTIYVYNAGPSTSTNVIVRDAIPTGTAYVSSIPTGTYYPNFQRVDIPIGNLTTFNSAYVTVTVQVTNAQQIVNFANAYGDTPDPNTSNNASGVTNNAVNPQVDLQVTKTVGTNSIFVGGTAPFTITVTNLGPNTASNTTVADVLPPGLSFSGAGVPGGTGFNPINGQWTIPSLSPGNGYSLALSAVAMNAGTFTNTAVLTGSTPADTNAANNSASAVVTATVFLQPADLQITETASSTNAPAGSQVVFRLDLQNLGLNNVTNPIVTTDCLPTGFQYISDNSGGAYSPGTCLWTLPGLGTNVIAHLFITTVATTNGIFTNTATVAVPQGYTDPNLNNNTSRVAVAVYPVYYLSGSVRGCQTNGSRLPLVTMTLSGAANATVMTDTNGFFIFSNLPNGVYTVTPSQPHNTFAPPNATIGLAANTVLPTFVGSGSLIQGIVSYGTNGGGVGGILVHLTGAQTHDALTDTNGYFIFPNLVPGAYTVTPVSTNGFIITPTNALLTLSATNCTGLANFTSTTRTVLLVALEVNQAIQDWSNSVPLIQNKETILRAFLQLPNATNPPVLIQGARLYAVGKGGPSQPPLNSNGVFLVQTANAAAGRSNFVNSLNFRLPAEWLSGALTLQLVCTNNVTVVPTNVVPPNSTVSVNFQPVAAPQVKFIGISWTNRTGASQTITDPILRGLKDRMQAVYPVASVDADYTLRTLPQASLQGTNSQFGDGTTNRYPNLDKINSSLMLMRALDSLFLPVGNRIYYGALAGLDYVAQQRGRFTVGSAVNIPGPAASGFTPNDPYGAVGRSNGLGRHTHSHEIGHDLGLEHDTSGALFGFDTNDDVVDFTTARGACGEYGGTNYIYPLFQIVPPLGTKPALGPMNLGVNALVYGLDTLTLKTTAREPVLSPYQYFDLMSYCRGASEDRWSGKPTYTNLLARINGLFSAPANPPPLGAVHRWLFVRGRIEALGNAAEFAPFVAVQTAATPASPPPGNYVLVALDANSNILDTVYFQPDVGWDDLDTDPAAEDQFLIPLMDDTPIKHVLLSDGINVLGELVASGNLPSVSSVAVTAPGGGAFPGGGMARIGWNSSDADPNAQLSYTVQFSADGGSTWETLAADDPESNYSVDSLYLHATTQGEIRVIASDGFNSSDPAYSSLFTVTNHPPHVSINAPMNGALFTADQQIILDASADDPQDGPLGGGSVQWNSNLNGGLGAGDSLTIEADTLSEGQHNITVTATDSFGLTNSDTTTFYVLRQPPPQISLQTIGAQIQLAWPAGFTNYVLESTTSLAPAAWAAVTNKPVGVDIQQIVTLDRSSATNRFFRLHFQ